MKAAQSTARPGRCCRGEPAGFTWHCSMMRSSISGLWIEGGASRLEINHAGARGRRVTRSILHRDNPSLRQLPTLESARFINELAAIALRIPQLHGKSPVRSLCHAIFIGGHTGQYGHLQSGPPDCTACQPVAAAITRLGLLRDLLPQATTFGVLINGASGAAVRRRE